MTRSVSLAALVAIVLVAALSFHSHLPATVSTHQLSTVVCGQGQLCTPTTNGTTHLGCECVVDMNRRCSTCEQRSITRPDGSIIVYWAKCNGNPFDTFLRSCRFTGDPHDSCTYGSASLPPLPGFPPDCGDEIWYFGGPCVGVGLVMGPCGKYDCL